MADLRRRGGTTGTTDSTDPRHQLELAENRIRMARDKGLLSESQAENVRKQLREGKATPSAKDRVLSSAGSVLGSTLRQVARPGQAALAAIGEYNRDYERAGRPLLPTFRADQLSALRKGWNLQQIDTPLSIAKEAGDIRVERGESPKAFGVGGDLRTNPLGAPAPLRGVANAVFDVGATAGVDPLTFLTLGTSGLSKQSLAAATKTLGPERAAVLATKGVKGLTEAERATLAETMTPALQRGLSGVRGGVGVRLPTARRLGEGRLLSEARTVVPGSAFAKAAKPLKAGGRALAGAPVPATPGRTTLAALPPVPEGQVRLWRGEELDAQGNLLSAEEHLAGRVPNPKRGETVGRWFADTPEMAEMYAKGAGRLRYVDVPADEAARFNTVRMSPEEIASIRGAGAVEGEYILSPERAGAAGEYRAAMPAPPPDVVRVIKELTADPDIQQLLKGYPRVLDEFDRPTKKFAEYAASMRGALRRDSRRSVVPDPDDPYGGIKLVAADPMLAAKADRLADALGKLDLSATERLGVTRIPATPGRRGGPLHGLTSTAGKVFRPREAIRRTFGPDAAKALDDARVRYKGTFASSVEDDIARITAAAKQAKVTTDELETVVGPALDIGNQSVVVPDRLKPVVAAFAEVRDNFTKAQIDAGLAREEAMHLTDEYLPRVLTEQGRKLFAEGDTAPAGLAVGGTPSTRGTADRFARGRTLMPESSVRDINAEFAERAGGPVFETNPAVSVATRSIAARKAVATKGFVDDIAKITDAEGKPLFRPIEEFATATPGYVRSAATKLPAGYVEVNVPRVGKFAAPKELADEVTKIAGLTIADEGLRGLKRAADSWMNLWKGYATVPFVAGLGFHERNAMGNVFNNWLAGISLSDPAYVRAASLQRRYAKGLKAGDAYKYLGPKDTELLEAARRYDIIGGGFYDADLPDKLADTIRPGRRSTGELGKVARKRLNPLSAENAIIASGRKLGSAIEENARLAHFLHMAAQTGDTAEAARSVRKYLFDYSDLTVAEKELFKRVHGFYTWTRKNTPLQFAELFRQPGKFAKFQQARIAAADQAEAPPELYPGYLEELGGVPLPMGVSQALSKLPGMRFDPNTQAVLAPDLPLTSASDTLSPLVHLAARLPGLGAVLPKGQKGLSGDLSDLLSNNLVGGAPGAVSTGAQLAAGREFFSGRELKEGRRTTAPAYASFLPFTQRQDGEPVLTDKSRFAAEALVPILSKIAGIFPRGEYEEDKAPRRRLSSLTGLRLYPLGESTQKGEAYRRLDAVRALIRALEDAGIEVPKNTPKKR